MSFPDLSHYQKQEMEEKIARVMEELGEVPEPELVKLRLRQLLVPPEDKGVYIYSSRLDVHGSLAVLWPLKWNCWMVSRLAIWDGRQDPCTWRVGVEGRGELLEMKRLAFQWEYQDVAVLPEVLSKKSTIVFKCEEHPERRFSLKLDGEELGTCLWGGPEHFSLEKL
jgi:hypothetical protein